MVGHGGSSAGSYLTDSTSPIPSHCASIVMTSTLRVNVNDKVTHFLCPPLQPKTHGTESADLMEDSSSQDMQMTKDKSKTDNDVEGGIHPFSKLIKKIANFAKKNKLKKIPIL